MVKKFNGIEPQLAASILYYDEEELEKFFSVYEQILSSPQFVVDGIFDKFVHILHKIPIPNISDPEDRKLSMLQSISVIASQDPDKNQRDIFKLWLDHISSMNVDMELADDILHHFLWDNFKKSIDLIDKSKVPFKEKLAIRPQILLKSEDEEIISLENIHPEHKETTTSYTTSILEVDKIVKMTKGNLIVIAARPAVGKSLLMLQMAIANAKSGIKTLFASFEMNKQQIDKRIVNHVANYNLQERYTDENGDLDFQGYKEAYDGIKASRAFKPIGKNLQLYVSKASSADMILDKLEKQIVENNYEVIFIDYLQLLKYTRLDEWASLRALTNALKNLAFRLNVLIVTASQVSRSSTEHGLYLSDLYGSSSIEADADAVFGLENPRERRQGELAVIILKVMKNREGDILELKVVIDYSIGKITVQKQL